ncbi:hypothetical protein T484DRAFT_1792551 [Baffinella frigidus]|nr:hypothetical protein T484DRAFT_1792551 [Cryptophyta sp. CCMP2293]
MTGTCWHVLVISRRKEARVADLSDAELCDLWRTARLVQVTPLPHGCEPPSLERRASR